MIKRKTARKKEQKPDLASERILRKKRNTITHLEPVPMTEEEQRQALALVRQFQMQEKQENNEQ